MRTIALFCSTIVLAALPANAQSEYPAKLEGHAVLPAHSFIDAPADAPADLRVSGKYTTGRRVDAVASVMGKSNDRSTGVALPFRGQPLQGHSGIKRMPDGTFWILTDNGFGAKANSPDAMLYLNHYRIDWDKAVSSGLKRSSCTIPVARYRSGSCTRARTSAI